MRNEVGLPVVRVMLFAMSMRHVPSSCFARTNCVCAGAVGTRVIALVSLLFHHHVRFAATLEAAWKPR